ncbi:MAG: hypothetical protein ACRDY0_04020 [Acidimicrobiales bacterium]
MSGDVLAQRLDLHLGSGLGQWPPVPTRTHSPSVAVDGSTRRNLPGWNGRISPICGVATPTAVISVPPDAAAGFRPGPASLAGLHHLEEVGQILAGLPAILGRPEARAGGGVFRRCHEPMDCPRAGIAAGTAGFPDDGWQVLGLPTAS